ncbi:hypothetical protein F5X97DRAFT_58877 [Nemania serpens]|nr:hypothetical protein F5X97DRAFT_58877 [Nemania serpens]
MNWAHQIDLERQDDDTSRDARSLCRKLQAVVVTAAICVAVNIILYLGLILSGLVFVVTSLAIPMLNITAHIMGVDDVNMLRVTRPNTILRSRPFVSLKRLARASRHRAYAAGHELFRGRSLLTPVVRRDYGVPSRYVRFLRRI